MSSLALGAVNPFDWRPSPSVFNESMCIFTVFTSYTKFPQLFSVKRARITGRGVLVRYILSHSTLFQSDFMQDA
jgi:hypothetical protein